MLHEARVNFRRWIVNQTRRFSCRAAAQFNPGLEVLRRGSLEVRVRVRCGAGGTGGQRLGGLGYQAGFGWATEMRETGKAPEPGHRLARDVSGKPSSHSIGRSDKPGFAL